MSMKLRAIASVLEEEAASYRDSMNKSGDSMKVYVVEYYENEGWGSRINNYDQYIDCDVTAEIDTAFELCKKHTGAYPTKCSEGWLSDEKHKICRIRKKLI